MKVRKIALALLCEYEASGKFVNLSLSSHKADGLAFSERGFLTVLLYTAVERKLTYDYLIGSIASRSIDSVDPYTKNILRLGLCQLLHLGSVPDHAAVDLTVALGRNSGERGFINGVMRTAARLKNQDALPMPDRARNGARYLSVRHSFPLATVKRFIALFGEDEAEQILCRYNGGGYTDITVNTLRISREDMLSSLVSQGYNAVLSTYSSVGIRILSSVDPTRISGFNEGYFFVQDEACAVSAEALCPEEGDRILDACACPGGKSFAAAILSGNSGRIFSRDIHGSKLSLVKEGATRLGLSSVIAEEADATLTPDEDIEAFDKIICDVPCSGLGVLGKKPDIRYRIPEGDGELPELQLSILRASCRKLKPGGVLLYSTCTLTEEENSSVVGRFLAEERGYSLCDFTVGNLKSQGGMLTLLPHIHQTDGFFMARIVKNI